jgi:hypothetical protein
MIEAFEIGISLALADGVSEGIARARKDADAVGRAVTAGSVSVERLRQAGLAALTVAQPSTQVAKTSGAAEALVKAPKHGGDARAAQDDGSGTALLQRKPADPAVLSAAGMNLAGGRAPVSEGGSGLSVEHRPEGVDHVQPAASAGHSAPLQLVTSHVMATTLPTAAYAGAVLPSASVAKETGVRGGGAPVMPPDARMGGGRLVGLRLDDYGSRGGNFAAAGAGPAGPEGGLGVPAGGDAEGAHAVGVAYRAPVFAPVSDPSVAASNGPAAGQPSPTGNGDAPTGGASQAPSAAHGDVFLDGALVGRWMSRMLSREAGRASAGPTGFDPRRNALLPGPTVGG